MANEEIQLETIPHGKLGIIGMENCSQFSGMVDHYLVKWRSTRQQLHPNDIAFKGYQRDTYLLKHKCARFGNGEAKGALYESVRGDDIFIIADVTNHSMTYNMCGYTNHYSPDDHYQDVKRIISAIGGKAKRINVIMPFLYESRQHRRTARESLDCALMLQELIDMGVENIITLDAHDPRVQNATPLKGFDNFMPTYQFLRALLKCAPDLDFGSSHFMVISPDEGALNRAVYFSNVLGADIGMFYKRRDYSRIVDGKNPIVAHEFLGDSVEGKDCVIIDDMISSGGSMLDVCRQIRERGAKRVFICTTFGLFTDGFDKFDKYYEEGFFTKLITTNLCYRPPELLKKPYYETANMYKYLASIINTLNHNDSMDNVRSTTRKIQKMIDKIGSGKPLFDEGAELERH